MAILNIADETLARLRAAAAARHVSVEAYLAQLSATDANETHEQSPKTLGGFRKSSPSERAIAADAIRKLAASVKDKASIEELIADKHAGHKY
jgi:plasmid stability protein